MFEWMKPLLEVIGFFCPKCESWLTTHFGFFLGVGLCLLCTLIAYLALKSSVEPAAVPPDQRVHPIAGVIAALIALGFGWNLYNAARDKSFHELCNAGSRYDEYLRQCVENFPNPPQPKPNWRDLFPRENPSDQPTPRPPDDKPPMI